MLTHKNMMARYSNADKSERQALHHEYYMQFAVAMKHECASFWRHFGISIDELARLYALDPNLNNFPMRSWLAQMYHWLSVHCSTVALIRQKIDGARTYSLSDGACILKTYIRAQILAHNLDKALNARHNENESSNPEVN